MSDESESAVIVLLFSSEELKLVGSLAFSFICPVYILDDVLLAIWCVIVGDGKYLPSDTSFVVAEAPSHRKLHLVVKLEEQRAPGMCLHEKHEQRCHNIVVAV